MAHSTSKDFMGTSLLKAGARLFAYSGMCRMTLNKKKQGGNVTSSRRTRPTSEDERKDRRKIGHLL